LHHYAKHYALNNNSASVSVVFDNKEIASKTLKTFEGKHSDVLNAALPWSDGVLSVNKTAGNLLYYHVDLKSYSDKNIFNNQNNGLEIHREYSVKRDGEWALASEFVPGDLVRVDLYVTAPAMRSFVVVEDKVPGALEPIDRNVRTSSRR
jgi:hypothetical protein